VVILTAAFILTMGVVTVYACWKGGAPEKLAAVSMSIASIASLLTNVGAALPFTHVPLALLWIDTCLLVALVALAAFADRFWPIWMAACHLVTVAAHGARAYSQNIEAFAYWLTIGKTSYPVVLILIIGIWRHHQRQHRRMPEYDWTFERRDTHAAVGSSDN